MIGNILPMSRRHPGIGLDPAQAARIGEERTTQVRAFRLMMSVAQQLRSAMDRRLRPDGMTTQQATLITLVRIRGRPSLSELALAMGTSHQNVKQIALALVRKGLLRLVHDAEDARVRRFVTTKKNERHWAERDPDDFEHVGRWFSPLSARETKSLFVLLLKLRAGLDLRIEPLTRPRARRAPVPKGDGGR
jgi:DNA-binding MarR family transcriptional regulator